MSEVNVIEEIAQSYARFQNEGVLPEENEYESSKWYVVQEILDCLNYDRNKQWAKENNVVQLEQDGGGEGGSEYCYMVFSWKDKIYKVDYRYYSHHGHDFDYSEVVEVKPTQKLVTVYESVK